MGLRVTPSMLYRTALADITRQRREMSETQKQASSGLSINKPSDDPSGTGAAMLLRSGIGAVEQFLRNNSNAASRVAAAESAVASTNDLMIRARELAIQGGNGSHSAESRAQIAREIETLHTALLSEANASHGGGYLFSGFANDTAPFSSAGAFGDIPPVAPTVSFAGDPNPIQLAIDQNETVQVSFDGRSIFMGDSSGGGAPDANRDDLFSVLADLRNALMNDDQAGVTASLDRIDTSINQLSAARTRIGATVTQLEAANDRLDTRQLNLEERLSTLQDADFAEVVSRLVQQEAALQAGLSAMARLVQPTLLDFLG